MVSIEEIGPLSRIEESNNHQDSESEEDVRNDIEALYPERKTHSKFSL